MKRFHPLRLCIGLILVIQGTAPYALATPASDITAIVEANNAFAIQLYQQLDTRPGNLFFSPIGIWADLALVYAGSRGRTATEIGAALHTTLPQTQLHPALAALSGNLRGEKDGSRLALADSLWLSDSYVCSDNFKQLIANNYGDVVMKTNFANPEKARQAINSWVAAQTDNRINDVIQPGTVGLQAGLLLVNSIYFKGDWRVPFDQAETFEQDFHLTSTQTVRTLLMGHTDNFGYADSDDFQVIVMPYKGRKLSMIVFLPKTIDGLHQLETKLTPQETQRWILTASHSSRRVRVEFPKFRMANEFQLSGALKTMGMREAFDPDHADFSGIGATPSFVADLIHAAYVDVSEQGTEAAATTAASLFVLDAQPLPASLPLFRADHPFLLMIHDTDSGAILFVGRLIDPSQ